MIDPSKKLPFIYVRPSAGGSQKCQNFDGIQAIDPYQRSPQFQDPPFQKVKYCEDAEFIEELGISLVTCDNGRPEWNTVMGTMSKFVFTKVVTYFDDLSTDTFSLFLIIVQIQEVLYGSSKLLIISNPNFHLKSFDCITILLILTFILWGQLLSQKMVRPLFSL